MSRSRTLVSQRKSTTVSCPLYSSLARHVTNTDASDLLASKMHRFSLQGSVFWMAPEVVKQSGHTLKADIWSVGCLVVEMLTGEHPWAQLTQMQAIFKVSERLFSVSSKQFAEMLVFYYRSDHPPGQLCHPTSHPRQPISSLKLSSSIKMIGLRLRSCLSIRSSALGDAR